MVTEKLILSQELNINQRIRSRSKNSFQTTCTPYNTSKTFDLFVVKTQTTAQN